MNGTGAMPKPMGRNGQALLCPAPFSRSAFPIIDTELSSAHIRIRGPCRNPSFDGL
jgi:hypothetical protein